ncbi:MAG: NAD(P)/FAD-dependent oxidoreductase [Bacteroidota bacterium]
MKKQVVVIGGGAAGFFAAITCAEKNPDFNITILEKSPQLLYKVKISGGGRCNVTHACFEPKQLVKNYPRGETQLLGPFTRFNPTNTIDWFETRGVELKAEDDGRMFPATDTSQTIIDCYLREAKRLKIKIETLIGVDSLQMTDDRWRLNTSKGEICADAVIVASGSSSRMWTALEKIGHSIVPAVPSLFTFNIKDERIKGLEGLSVDQAKVTVVSKQKLNATGPLLITHWGMSGPAILRLSAWDARELAATNHKFEIEVNWINKEASEVKDTLKLFKQNHPKKNVVANPLFSIPRRLWERLVSGNSLNSNFNFADLSNKQIELLAETFTASRFSVSGKSTYKDEFVTAGGIDLNEVDFKTMQSKKWPGLFFAGEVLDIDAITGGFNFQAAWTTGWIAGTSIGSMP